MKDAAPFALAGLWERWRNREEETELESCTIIVTEANKFITPIHDRMPVILSPTNYSRWLDPDAGDVNSLLTPCSDDWLDAYPVSDRLTQPGFLRSGIGPIAARTHDCNDRPASRQIMLSGVTGFLAAGGAARTGFRDSPRLAENARTGPARHRPRREHDPQRLFASPMRRAPTGAPIVAAWSVTAA